MDERHSGGLAKLPVLTTLDSREYRHVEEASVTLDYARRAETLPNRLENQSRHE